MDFVALFQPFQAKLAETTDPDKKQMLERLDTAVTAALTPLQGAVQNKAGDAAIQSQAEVGVKSGLKLQCSCNRPSLILTQLDQNNTILQYFKLIFNPGTLLAAE